MVDSVKRITILGATGSIGDSTLDLIRRNPERFCVEAVTAQTQVAKLAAIARETKAKLAVIGDASLYTELQSALSGSGIAVAAGSAALVEAAERPSDLVMAAMVGASGLSPILAAIRRGTTVAFANKEVLVSAGEFMMREITQYGATLIPVDSEHNAIFQVFYDPGRQAVEKLILTASGGPFYGWSLSEMAAVTPEQAVKHPNWSMGAKISVDSATMMNKGLEVIEAHYLFQMPEAKIEIIVHPQSVIHSLVGYCDGSVLATLGTPDMRTPIAYALAWPQRMYCTGPRLDLAAIGQLSFSAPDLVAFPALRLARHALIAAGGAPTVLNAANEVAVEAFLQNQIGFTQICHCVEDSLERLTGETCTSLEAVIALDQRARQSAMAWLKTCGKK